MVCSLQTQSLRPGLQEELQRVEIQHSDHNRLLVYLQTLVVIRCPHLEDRAIKINKLGSRQNNMFVSYYKAYAHVCTYTYMYAFI
mgnify:CR=1 FL=1